MTDDFVAAYAELGLKPEAADREVKVAWRRLVSRLHPDRNDDPGAVARLLRVNRAFELLRQRADHDASSDETSHAPAHPPAAEPPAPPRESQRRRSAETSDDDDHDDGAGQAPGARRSTGEPISLSRTVKLDLEEGARGCVKTLRGQWRPVCATCEGSGQRSQARPCDLCEGRGKVMQRGWFGWTATMEACSACEGTGKRHDACPDCAGRGTATALRWQVGVRIPAGARDGDRLRVNLPKRRDALDGAQLQLRIALQPHPLFSLRDDGRLSCELPVDGFAWMAERTVAVPTPDGPKSLALKRDRREYRLAGAGFPVERRGAPGELLVVLRPEFPESLSAEQQALLDRLMAAGEGPQAERLAQWEKRRQAWERDWAKRREPA